MRMNRYIYLLMLFSCILPSGFLNGQGVCSNSALAPVYSQTFGTSPSSSTKTTVPLGFITNYHFDKVGTDGNYIVTPLVQNSAKADWTSGGDHTGNVNGNLFLVNAGTGASLFFYQQVDNLCPGSVFNFSAWLANVNTPNTLTICGNAYVYPKVIFNIKNTAGVKLASDTTGNLPLSPNAGPVNWQQHNFQFALPSGTTSLILEMVDYYGGKPQCGNDLALDDIVFSACTPLVTASLTTASTICYGTSTSITSTLTNSPFSHPAYQWQKSVDGGTTWNNIGGTGDTATSFSMATAVVSDGGLYRLIVGPDIASLTSSTCIAASNAVSLSVNPALLLTVGGNSQICTGNSLNLTSTASGGTGPYLYAWTGPNGFTSTLANPSIANISTAASGTYSLVMTDGKLCTVTSSLAVTVGTTPFAVAPILGSSGGCLGTKFSLSDSSVDGIWSSNDTTIATINANGMVTLINNGTVAIAYTVTNGFCTAAATKIISAASVILHPEIVECNNGITHFKTSDPYYGVSYSNSNLGNSYAWTFSGGPFSFQSATSSVSQYPDLQLMSGSAYQVIIQFTTNGITCRDTQMVYKNIITADSIDGSHDTTICFNAISISLLGKASKSTNTHDWTTSGTGIFSNPHSLVTTYTPSMADKASGSLKIYLKGTSTLNATGNCVSVAAMDSMTLNILPDNVGVNSSQVFCSNQSLHFIPSATIVGSSFSWTSTVLAGSITGNTANGTGTILDSLVNLSNSDAIVLYTITPFVFTPTNKTCIGTPFTYTITSKPNPAITITNNPVSICSGSNTNIQFASTISGTSFSWTSSVMTGNLTGNSSQAIPSGTNTITDHLVIVSNTNATVIYRITATSPAACSKTDSTDVFIYGNPTLANAGADQSLCNVGLSLLEGNSPIVGTGTWQQISGPSAAGFGTQQAATSTIQGLIAGTYLFTWTITNGSCTVSVDTVAINNAPQTFGGNLTGDATICSGTNTGILTLSGYIGKITGWEISVDGGSSWTTINNDTSNQYTYHNLSVTTLFRASVKSGSCSPISSNAATIIVLEPVSTADAGPDQLLCNTTSATFAATVPISGTGKWSAIPSNPSVVSFTDPFDRNTTVNGFTNGTYQFIWTVSNSQCVDSKDTVTITVYPATHPGTLASSATVCSASNNGTLTFSGFTGNVLGWESSTDNGISWNKVANTNDSIIYTNLIVTTRYRALIQSGVCTSAYTNSTTISVLPATTIANGGPDQILCNTSTTILSANTPGSGTGIWNVITGNPSAVNFIDQHDPTSVVQGLKQGIYLFTWTISNGICANSIDTVSITVLPPTIAGNLMADAAAVCSNTNHGTLFIAGYSVTILRWEFSTDQGSTWTAIASTSPSLTYNNLSTTTQYRVIVQSGVCNALYSNVITIHVYQLTAGGLLTPSYDTACAILNTGSIYLQGFKGTILHWELSTDFGYSWTILPHTDSTYKYKSLKISSWYRVLIQEGVCSSAYSKIAVIKVDPTTVPGILKGTNVVCKGSNTGQLYLGEKKGNILRWEFSTDQGTSWNSIPETKDTLSYGNLLTSTIYRVLVKNGACATDYSNTIEITIVPPPSNAYAGVDQVICDEKTTTKLEGNTPTTGAGIWTMASGPSKISFSNASLPGSMVMGLQTGTYQFVWTISNDICANSIDTVQIKVDKVTASFSLTNYTDCGEATFQFTNTSQSGFGLENYQWFTGTGDTITTKEIRQVYTTEGVRSMSLQVLSKSGCISITKATYDVTIFQYPKANIDAIASACKNQLMQVASNVSSKDSIIYLLWNLNNTTRMKDSVVTVQYMTDGIYAVKLTVATINRCFDSAYKQINVHPLPIVTLTNSATICKGDTALLTAGGALNYIWTDQTEKVICNGCTTTIVRPSSNSEYKVIGYSEYGCSEIKTTKIRVIQPFTIATSPGDTICLGQSTHLFAAGAATYNWYPDIGLNNVFTAAPIAKPLKTISYQVIGKDDFNCFSDTAEVNIVVGIPTTIYLGKDTVIAAGSLYQLIARSEIQNIRKWHWNGSVDFSSRTIADPIIKIVNDATITCLAVNAFGCPSTDTLNIKTFCPGTDVFIPNAFTPDGDGINDLLIVQGKGVKMIKSLRIFNRWGEIVFEKMNFLPGDRANGWDGRIRGKAAPPDIFVYVCEVICEKGIPSIFKGNVAILK